MRSMPMKRNDRWSIDTIDLTTGQQEEQPEETKFISWFKRNWKRLLIIVGIVYVLILSFGIASTRYYTDESGNRKAYQVTFSNLKTEDDYRELTEKFKEIRSLLVDITIIDIHVANGELGNYEAATQYTALLNDRLDVLIPKISALNVQDEQTALQEEMESILSYDLALYLQNMAAALKTGDNNTVATALSYRDRAFSTYELINKDMKTLSEKLKMGDADFYNWILQDAVLAKDKTAVLAERGE